MHKKLGVALALTLLSNIAQADQALDHFVEMLHARYPATANATIQPAFPGFYSIVDGNQVLYIRDDLSVLIRGDVVDLATGKSLSAKIMSVKADPSMFKVEDAIHMGSGSEKLIIFTDPDCPFCRQLEPELAKLHDVNISIYEMPLVSLHPNSARVSQDIWCSANKASVWDDYLQHDIAPKTKDCDNPIARNLALANQLHISGTPALIFPDGTVHMGYLPAYEIQARLDQLSHAKK